MSVTVTPLHYGVWQFSLYDCVSAVYHICKLQGRSVPRRYQPEKARQPELSPTKSIRPSQCENKKFFPPWVHPFSFVAKIATFCNSLYPVLWYNLLSLSFWFRSSTTISCGHLKTAKSSRLSHKLEIVTQTLANTTNSQPEKRDVIPSQFSGSRATTRYSVCTPQAEVKKTPPQDIVVGSPLPLTRSVQS